MQHAYANVNGIRMHYVTHGQGEPIVFIHGFPSYWGLFTPLLKDLGEDHLCVVPDIRGFGETSKPAEVDQYRIETLVEDVKQLVDQLGLRKFTLVSHAFVGWNFALTHPEYVKRFITLGITHPFLFTKDLREDPKQQELSQYMLFFRNPAAAAVYSANDFAALRQLVFDMARKNGATISAEDEQAWVDTWKDPMTIQGGINQYLAVKIGPPDGKGDPGGSILLDNIPQEKWKLNLPVLALVGGANAFLVEGGFKGLEQFCPDLTIHTIPGGSHWVILERPAEVIQQIRGFMAKKG